MKKMRRFAALLLAMIMVLAMGMTAMATEEKEPTAQTWNLKINAASGHTYKVYQLLVGDVSSDKKLSNVKIGASATVFVGCVGISESLGSIVKSATN